MLAFRPRTRCLPASLLAISLVGVLAQIAGCASSGSTAAPAADHRASTPSADARFLQAAERSSAWAVQMSDHVIANGARFEVKAAARSIKARETVNLAMLAKERTRLGMPEAVTDYHSDAHLTADEERLATTRGEEADDLYIQHMLEQRRDMISLAIFARPELESPSLSAFAGSLPKERERDASDLRRVQFAVRMVPEGSRAQRGIPTGQSTGIATGIQTAQPATRRPPSTDPR